MFNKQKSSMETEIFEQSNVLENLLKTHVNDNNYILFDIPTDIQKVVLVASGSSYHCARYAADLFGNTAQIEARAIYSSEFLLKSTVPHDNDILYVFITQSGETSDTNSALKKAKEYGMRTLCITNKKGSTIWEAADFKIDCCAGEEKSIAATKSLTTYELHSQIKETAKFLSKFKNIVITADGISYAIAKEASLKIKETSYINVYSNILGEFMHGHVAILNNKPAFIHISINELSYTAIRNLNKIEEDYNPPICIIGCSNEKIKAKHHINIDCESDIVKSFCIVVIAQLIALETAKALGRNVDKPHGLNKIVK